jgi:transcriptional antiterminator
MMTAHQSGEVVAGYDEPAFATVGVPTEKPREEYTAAERRAEIDDIITDLGHPSLVNQTELAQRYGVSQPQIHKDIQVIAEYAANSVGDQHELEVESVFRRSIRGLLEDEEWRKAARTAKDYADWMNDRSDIEELREELDLLKQATDFDS